MIVSKLKSKKRKKKTEANTNNWVWLFLNSIVWIKWNINKLSNNKRYIPIDRYRVSYWWVSVGNIFGLECRFKKNEYHSFRANFLRLSTYIFRIYLIFYRINFPCTLFLLLYKLYYTRLNSIQNIYYKKCLKGKTFRVNV